MQHAPETLLPLSRFPPDVLNATVASMQLCYEGRVSEPFVSDYDGQLDSGVVVLDHDSFTTAMFRGLWRCGAPIIVRDVHTSLQGGWTPADFIKDYGTRSVELINCASGEMHRSSVTDFFSRMSAPESGVDVMKLKVSPKSRSLILNEPHIRQDWPPQKHLRKEFPHLFEAFSLGSPCPDLTLYKGILNLASHYPVNSAVAPDLGNTVLTTYFSR